MPPANRVDSQSGQARLGQIEIALDSAQGIVVDHAVVAQIR